MKYFLVLFIISAFLVSCDDEEGILNLGGPTMTVSVTPPDDFGTISGGAGEVFSFDVDITADEGFNVFRVNEIVDGSSTNLWERTRASGTDVTSFDTVFTYTLSAAYIDQNVQLELEVVDDEGETTTDIFTIEVTSTVRSFTQFLLVPPSDDEASKTFFSTTTGERYSVNDVEAGTNISSADIDFGYYYGQTNMATLQSPAQFPNNVGNSNASYNLADWNELNTTELKMTNISLEDFMANDDDVSFIQDAFTNASAGANSQMATNLVKDDIVAFKLDEDQGGKFGLIRVIEVKTGTGVDDGITIEVLIVE